MKHDVILLRVNYVVKALNKCLPLVGMTLDGLRLPNNARNISDMRSTIQHILRNHTGLSLEQIGSIFERDHTTIIYNVRKVDGLLKVDKGFAVTYEEVKELVCDHLWFQLNKANLSERRKATQ